MLHLKVTKTADAVLYARATRYKLHKYSIMLYYKTSWLVIRIDKMRLVMIVDLLLIMICGLMASDILISHNI